MTRINRDGTRNGTTVTQNQQTKQTGCPLVAHPLSVVSDVSAEYCHASVVSVTPSGVGVVDRSERPSRLRRLALAACAILAIVGTYGVSLVSAQPVQDAALFSPYEGRPIRTIRFEGLSRVTHRYASIQIRSAEGQGFSASMVTDDIRRLYGIYEFETVEASVEPHEDGSVTLVYTVVEAPIVQAVEAVGNRRISDEELAEQVARTNLVSGVPMDRFRIDRARRAIEELYQSKGYHTASVTVDEEELQNGVVLFRVREGERVRLMSIRFQGARSFSEKQLRRNVSTKTANLFRKGGLNEDSLDADVTSLIQFYTAEGFLNVRVDRQLTIAPNGKEAVATFLIDEGPRFRLREVRVERLDGVEAPAIFSPQQVIGLIPTKPGDAYATNAGARAAAAVLEAYNGMGFVDAQVRRVELRDPEEPFIDLVIQVSEGQRYRTGEVIVQGNTISKSSVIYRDLRFYPDRPIDVQSIPESEAILQQRRLFSPPSATNPAGGVRITLQQPDQFESEYRDVLVEVEDANTGSITFLAAVSADSGLVGQIQLTERNFDIGNFPKTWGDLLSRRAFRGAGQTFQLTVAPGTEIQNYSISFTEPRFLQSDTSFNVAASLRDRIFDDYEQETLRGQFGLGRRFGDRWTANLGFRIDNTRLTDLEPDAPVDAFTVADRHTYSGVSLRMTRTTVPTAERLFPTRGTRTELGVEQIFGDFNFTKLTGEFQFFLPVNEDALGRISVLSLKLAGGYIPQKDEAPIYERFYLGGSSFRGFDFRGVSPRGIANNTGLPSQYPNGGNFMFFAGIEFSQPIYQEILSVVGFIDSGTVQEDIGFDQYRVSVGAGLRIRVPALGPVPLAFDFGFPIVEQEGDQTRLFTFTADIPF